MKVKVTHQDKSIVLDIPADKVMVLLDSVCQVNLDDTSDTVDMVRFIEDHGDVVELKCDNDGEAALFYNPVWMADFAPSEEATVSRIACGYATWIGLTGTETRPSCCKFEDQFLRTEEGFDIITTPRSIAQVVRLTEEYAKCPDALNYRSHVALGTFGLSRNDRLSDAILEEVLSYLKTPREDGKDYSVHAVSEDFRDPFFNFIVKKDPDWFNSPNRDSKGYWDNVGLFKAFY